MFSTPELNTACRCQSQGMCHRHSPVHHFLPRPSWHLSQCGQTTPGPHGPYSQASPSENHVQAGLSAPGVGGNHILEREVSQTRTKEFQLSHPTSLSPRPTHYRASNPAVHGGCTPLGVPCAEGLPGPCFLSAPPGNSSPLGENDKAVSL